MKNTKAYQVAAVLIIYFPNEHSLIKILSSIHSTVEIIYVIDNTPIADIAFVNRDWFESHGFKVIYIQLKDNFGIAHAQNIGIKNAASAACSHIIFFDQDSEASFGLVDKLLEEEKRLLSSGINVGTIGPAFFDTKTQEYAPAITHGYFFISRKKITSITHTSIQADYVISSGSLTRLSVYGHIGGLLDDLFIDWVDIEWCLRAKRMGYQNYIVPAAKMQHCIGDTFIKTPIRSINIHNDLRNFYIVRNACYLLRYGTMGINWNRNIFLKIPMYIIFYSFTSKNKWHSFKLLLKAARNGFQGKIGKATI
jgi:rhamnosyltransferase